MKALFQNLLSVLGAVGFLVSMSMLLSRPTNFASYVPEIPEVIEEAVEDPTVRIVLDAGHGGLDGGCGYQSLVEKELSLKTVRMVKAELEAAGLENVEVVLTRNEDLYLSSHQRVAVANRYPKCYFVSVHFNASRHRSAHGTETYYADPKPKIIQNQLRRRLEIDPEVPITDPRGQRFAETVQQALVSQIGTRDRGTRNNPRLVLPREVIGPSVLVECVFLSNPTENAKLKQGGQLQKIARGIADGILKYVRETGQDPYAMIVAETPAPALTPVAEE